MNTANKVQAINEHLENQGYYDDMIYNFDEDTINQMFSSPWKAFKECYFGDINFTNHYFRLDAYGNIETLSDYEIDEEFEALETDEEEEE